jgi:hypothetical protein
LEEVGTEGGREEEERKIRRIKEQRKEDKN